MVASSDVVSEQCIASTVCVSSLDSGHRSVYGGTFTHAGVVRQVQEDWVVVIDVPNVDPHHHLKKKLQD